MSLGKISKILGKDVIAWTRTSGKNLLATRPIKTSSFGIKYARRLDSDVIQASKKLIKADSCLFSWAKTKPAFSMTSVNPDSLVLVHMTNYYPKNGQILSANLATKASDGVGAARTTVHFALNKPVTEHALGYDWNTMDYAIIAPFKETVKGVSKSKVIGGIQDDFFFQGAVNLPKGSVIVKYNPKVGEGHFLVSDAFDGIKLVETSNRNLNEATNTVIKKMGFSTYNDELRKFLGASKKEMELLTSIPEEDLRKNFMSINNCGSTIPELIENQKNMLEFLDEGPELKAGIEDSIKWLNLCEKFSDKLNVFPKSWEKFCSREGYINMMHSKTPWFNAEMGISLISTLEKFNKNSWGTNIKQNLINILNDAQKSLPKGKSLGYDIKKVVKIIEESETPKIALEKIEKELKLKPMPLKQYVPNLPEENILDFSPEELIEFLFQN